VAGPQRSVFIHLVIYVIYVFRKKGLEQIEEPIFLGLVLGFIEADVCKCVFFAACFEIYTIYAFLPRSNNKFSQKVTFGSPNVDKHLARFTKFD